MWTRFRRAWVAYGYGAAAVGGGIGGLAATVVFAALLEIARSGALDVVVPFGAWSGLACAPAFGAWRRLSRGTHPRVLGTAVVTWLVSTFVFLLGWESMTRVGGLVLLGATGVVGGALSASIARAFARVTIGRAEPRPARFLTKLVVAAIMLVTSASLSVWAGGSYATARAAWEDLRAIFREAAMSPANVVCEERMTEACAVETARRVDARIAWLSGIEGFDFAAMIALPDGRAEQSFVSRTGDIVTVGVITRPPRDPHPPSEHEFSIRWQREGIAYELSVSSFLEPVARGLARELAARVRYAEPPA